MKNALLNLKSFAIIFTTIIFISLISERTCKAQSFTNTPNDSIIGTGTMDISDFYNIFQEDNSSDTIFLHWEKVSAQLPDQWEGYICDNFTCWGDLHQSGNMDSVWQNKDGMLSVHFTPHINAGTAIVRYAVWDISNPAIKDTLTWIITAYQTGISSLNQSAPIIFVSGNELVIQKSDPQLTSICICNMEGRILFESVLNSNNTSLEVSNLPTGIYFIEAIGENKIFSRKILIQ